MTRYKPIFSGFVWRVFDTLTQTFLGPEAGLVSAHNLADALNYPGRLAPSSPAPKA